MNEDINGIIVNGRFYKLLPKGSYHCSDCDLYDRCTDEGFYYLCVDSESKRYLYRFSQELTDKLNKR